MINERKAKRQTKKMEMKLRGIKVSENKDKLKEELEKSTEENIHPLKMLFDLTNVKDMVKCCLKSRPNKLRTQIWLLFVSMIIILMAHNGQYNGLSLLLFPYFFYSLFVSKKFNSFFIIQVKTNRFNLF